MPTYQCLIYRQRSSPETPEFCLFHAPVSEILDWCDIKRLETEQGGAQRSLNESRVRAVKRFLEDDLNTVPTSVIISLGSRGVTYPEGNGPRTGQITIECVDAQKAGVLIDGQHRLIGMSRSDAEANVNVVALLTDDENEAAFQFFVINNKSSRVPTDHIKSLLAERANTRLRERIKKARLSISPTYEFVATADSDDESPFRGLIDWPTNRTLNKWIKPSAIEAAISDMQERKIREFNDDDFIIECFFIMWRVIHQRWPELWTAESRLLSKVGIVCMTQHLTNMLVGAYDLGELDISNLESTEARVRAAIDFQKPEFWTTHWESASYDTHTGRKQVVQSLVQVSRNVRAGIEWSEDVLVVSGH
ncbi:MAG: DGQHR domain-containing protein [Planctomycetia bacterium]